MERSVLSVAERLRVSAPQFSRRYPARSQSLFPCNLAESAAVSACGSAVDFISSVAARPAVTTTHPRFTLGPRLTRSFPCRKSSEKVWRSPPPQAPATSLRRLLSISSLADPAPPVTSANSIPSLVFAYYSPLRGRATSSAPVLSASSGCRSQRNSFLPVLPLDHCILAKEAPPTTLDVCAFGSLHFFFVAFFSPAPAFSSTSLSCTVFRPRCYCTSVPLCSPSTKHFIVSNCDRMVSNVKTPYLLLASPTSPQYTSLRQSRKAVFLSPTTAGQCSAAAVCPPLCSSSTSAAAPPLTPNAAAFSSPRYYASSTVKGQKNLVSCAGAVTHATALKQRTLRQLLLRVQRWRDFWSRRSLVQKACYSSLLLNVLFILFMGRRLFKEQRQSRLLWEKELQRNSKTAADWKCYHFYRLFLSQCASHYPRLTVDALQQTQTHRENTQKQQRFNSYCSSSVISAEESTSEHQKPQSEDPANKMKREISDTVDSTDEEDELCLQLEKHMLQCRQDVAKLIPGGQTLAMQPITDITNRPPWLEERPIYKRYFENVKKRNEQFQ